jgi:hypothetical protein
LGESKLRWERKGCQQGSRADGGLRGHTVRPSALSYSSEF